MKIEQMTPRVPRIYLLLIAALVWTFAGGMLLVRGSLFLKESPQWVFVKILGCLVGGLLFFKVMFNRISGKHVARIVNFPLERPSVFSFFNLKSYLMMAVMISGGITLRKSGIVPVEYMAIIYLTMGIPLLMSSFRFYYTFFTS
jgi:hypothetical protein